MNRPCFFSVAAKVMRHILVDHARAHKAEKRGGGDPRLALDEAVSFFEEKDVNLVALDEALKELAEMDARQARIVEMRFFGGLTTEEIAEVLQVTEGEVRYDWRAARRVGSRAVAPGRTESCARWAAAGWGFVYLAERDDESFRQRVAVKVVKRGLDTEDILRRFRNERQILASLHHPHIAKVFDGGETDDGLPYFVMEYVEGLPLMQYCDEHGLAVEGRLRLFLTVCSAVAYAHRNLVVHRDLKPSNIFVTHADEWRFTNGTTRGTLASTLAD